MPTVNLPQGDIFYLESKAENVLFPPVVLVHGAGGSHQDWPPELQHLPGAHVLALDLPGHGGSTGPGCADTLAYADVVGAVLDHLGIERAIIAGHSMGGAIAQQIAIHRPDRAAGLILAGTGSKLAVEPTLTHRIITEHEVAVGWLTDLSWAADTPGDVKQAGRQRLLAVPPVVLQGDYLACQAFDARPYLEQITAPTLVLGSDADRMVPLKFSATLAERMPNATLVVINGAGHNFPLERAGAVVQAVTGWVSQQWPAQ